MMIYHGLHALNKTLLACADDKMYSRAKKPIISKDFQRRDHLLDIMKCNLSELFDKLFGLAGFVVA